MRQIAGDCPRLKRVKSEKAEREQCLNCKARVCWEDITDKRMWYLEVDGHLRNYIASRR